jgi:hypothetical protein
MLWAFEIDYKGHWQWCITIGIAGFLDFVHRPVFERTVIEVRSSYWNQQSRCLHPLHLRTETDPLSETLCSLVFFIIPDDGQSRKASSPRD